MPGKEVSVQGVTTVVGSEGILVSALSFFDVSSALDGRTVRGSTGNSAKLDVSMDNIKQLVIVLTDGTEVPGQLILKDTALDLVVVRAEENAWRRAGGDKLPVVDLAKSSQTEVLDEVLVVGLASAAMGRETLGVLPCIMAKTRKPRIIYRSSFVQKGGPAFLLDGRVLGIGAQLIYQERSVNEGVIIAATDVAELVRQALETRPKTNMQQ